MMLHITDDNECTNGVANCNHFCLNTAGSYSCYCQSGYELAAQGDSDTCVGKVSRK